jgi:YEATS domain-containing protein 4
VNIPFKPVPADRHAQTSTNHLSRSQRQGEFLHLQPSTLIYVVCRWGEFEIIIRITFIQEAAEKTMTLLHHLKLHPWTVSGEPEIPPLDVALKAGPVHSWQYDEIVFNDPFQNFLNLLTAHPPTLIPKAKRKPIPFHLANPGSFEESKGGTPEFHAGMIAEEADRLDEARKKIIAETERLRNELIQKEAELEKAKKQLADGA